MSLAEIWKAHFMMQPSTSGPCILTSIPPIMPRKIAGLDISRRYQIECVNSWRSSGFRVVSLNCNAEIENLSEFRATVEFVEIQSPIPKIHDFLNVSRSLGDGIYGLINADCLLFLDDREFADVMHHADSGLLLFERIELGADRGLPNGNRYVGFDFFLYDGSIISQTIMDIIAEADFVIGQPCWDYFIPLLLRSRGISVVKCNCASLFHLEHDFNRDQGKWLDGAAKLFRNVDFDTPFLPDDIRAIGSKLSVIHGPRFDESQMPDLGLCIDRIYTNLHEENQSNMGHVAETYNDLFKTLENPAFRKLYYNMQTQPLQSTPPSESSTPKKRKWYKKQLSKLKRLTRRTPIG